MDAHMDGGLTWKYAKELLPPLVLGLQNMFPRLQEQLDYLGLA